MPCLHMDIYLVLNVLNILMSCFSSLPDGNCLFSSASLLISGTNDFIHDLRILTAFELFENCQQYCDHSLFSEVYNENRTVVYLPLFVTYLMSVLPKNIITWYPDVSEVKYKLIFSRSVEPIGMYLDNSSMGINLLWCPLGSDKPNHFVPLIESYKQVKCNGKRKRTSTETSIGTPSTSKYSQKSVSDYFEKSFEEVSIISPKMGCHHPPMRRSSRWVVITHQCDDMRSFLCPR